jgi:hypothetical protein
MGRTVTPSPREIEGPTLDEGRQPRGERPVALAHHLHPFGFGGGHRPEDMGLMCRAHNSYLAEHDYGREAMARFRRPGKRISAAAAAASAGTEAAPRDS